MRWLTLFLALLIAALQYPLWLGKGSWLRVWEVDQKIAAQKQVNQGLKARNASLEAEVRDLKQGYDAIEERARSELGLVKQDEVFFQVLDNDRHSGTAANAAAKTPPGKSVTPVPKP
ncbi:cell division protein FtsB [Sulfurimicrobium lacus]|uniref:Cell division protein FtsB n=1 Tax=Sulfurimicrobium lacus TaxID=2715678 RepID=A0A6F8VC98_9PROT|nr:cell division protein FtsB [Sulfurimicrobium lacus]BCB26737.1 cell division protein FtsB [Sulfurimicrobium lacus]